MDQLDLKEGGGPMYFFFMTEKFAAMSIKTKWALTSYLKKLMLKDFDGEDADVVSMIILRVM
eukprot:2480428-Ditylum_brightwellii.AAC.1